jgi:hypothetical protein
MAAELLLTTGFGREGDGQAYLGEGWAAPEAGFTWTTGAESLLAIPLPDRGDAGGDLVLSLDTVPFVHPTGLPHQRLSVLCNDSVIGSATIGRPALLAFRIPAALIPAEGPLRLTLQHPDATRPASIGVNGDTRQLACAISELRLYRIAATTGPDARPPLPPGLMLDGNAEDPFGAPAPIALADWVKARTGLGLGELAMQFESLGENCEFGLVQRRADAEPLGLLRFSSTFLHNLLRGLEARFEGLGGPDEVQPRLSGDAREYMIHEKRYGLVYHTFVYEGQRSADLMKEQETARLKFLRRKFIEELEIGEKIFVYKRNGPVSEAEILALYLALNQFGPNTLLWVVPADPRRPAGTVEVMLDGLLKGHIDRFAPDENAHDLSFESWIKLCANAWLLSRLRGGDMP